MKSSIIVGVIVVIVVFLAGWLLLRSGNSGQEVLTPTPLTTQVIEATPTPTEVPSVSPTISPSSSVSPTVSPTAATRGATVNITAGGFSPSAITVKSGTTVTFVNQDSAPHWPASNPHPTHTDLPGFDAKHALVTGESYSFVFQKIGTWGYHDHLNPSTNMGTVTVQP